jgi:isopenicillin N synthase-like dioxygenase
VTQPASLPILDLSRFDDGPAERAAFVNELNRTARDIGFFYLVGCGIEQDTADRLIAMARVL